MGTGAFAGAAGFAAAGTAAVGVAGTAGGDVTDGFITPGAGNGNTASYQAPIVNPPGSVTITAVSAVDPAESGSASVILTSSAAPTITSSTPNLVGEGSAQQEVFLTGTNFTSNSVALAMLGADVTVNAGAQLCYKQGD